MKIKSNTIDQHNEKHYTAHKRKFDFIFSEIPQVETIIQKLMAFNVAIPSWALGTGGTRFARFSGGGEPGTLEEVYEPFLIQEGFIMRTPRGREATEKAYRHIGKVPHKGGTQHDLFDN